MPNETDLTHYMQLRLSPGTVAEIDQVIATVPELYGLDRSKFIRYATRYALYCVHEHQQEQQAAAELAAATEPGPLPVGCDGPNRD